MGKTKICHITSVHSSDDARIFHKECVSLNEAGYEVYLVAPGASRIESGVHVVGMGEKPNGIFKRATTFAKRMIHESLKLNCSIYHLHDPELLLYVNILKKHNKMVVFDSHEDYYFDSFYFPKPFVGLANIAYRHIEKKSVSKVDGLICCYRKTKERLEPYCHNVDMIYNFPIVSDTTHKENIITDNLILGYAGGIDDHWNHETVLEAIKSLPNVMYRLAGNTDGAYLEKLKEMPSWKKVKYYGRIPFSTVQKEIYADSDIGVALLSYIRECNGKEGNLSNTKLFEIMDAGLPVIATDFILWKKVVEGNKCGICVNPYSSKEVKDAISYIMDNPLIRIEMGKNAKKAIQEKYNWKNESQKLIRLYKEIESK